MDFLKVTWRNAKRKGQIEIYPVFITKATKDLMIRGGDFYAIWDERKGLWSKSQDDVVDIIDGEMEAYKAANIAFADASILYLWNGDTGMIDKWHKYCQKQMNDNYHNLDGKLVFANSPVNKEDYASRRLPYSLEEGDISAWDELVGTLYSPEERHKIEWAIGAVVSGDSIKIQKFLVFYGSAGTGKSTILNIIQKLFDGYYSVFDARALGSSTDSFALEPFKNNPLVAIQHDGDLSRIEDNTRLNSLVSHEIMTINEKYSKLYATRINSFLFMGTNKPVRITDSKSGIIRRLIDVSPTEKKLPLKKYNQLMKQIDFELGAIAWHCLKVYEDDKNAYDDYIPKSMIGATNDFYNFMEENLFDIRELGGISLAQAWAKYNEYCNEAKVSYPYSKRIFKEELKNYFHEYSERGYDSDGKQVWNYYSHLKMNKFGLEDNYGKQCEDGKSDDSGGEERDSGKDSDIETSGDSESNSDRASMDLPGCVGSDSHWLKFDAQESIFDIQMSDAEAQYADDSTGAPKRKWENSKTLLGSLKTSKLHYVRVPENHIVIDFDLKDESGEKSLEKNIEAASKWPPTYAELSKSGQGIHLHYIYTGEDAKKLSRIYEDGIEVKVFTGNSSLRRKLTKCVNLPFAKISSGLPLKSEDKMVNFDSIKNEKALRTIIRRSLAKEYAPHATVTSVEFIFKVLNDAYDAGMHYDVTDLRPYILTFAAKSTHHASDCLKKVDMMKFKSEDPSDYVEPEGTDFVFYDCEVFPNLFLVNWKVAGEGKKVARMINPSPNEIEELLHYKLIGFNCRRYDNHMLYARMLGYSTEQLYGLSQKIINGGSRSDAFFAEAYNLSYTDVYDFCSTKQSLKKWEIELGIHHQELGLPWDQPVPEDMWQKVAEYCDNDVIATEAVFNARKQDFIAREILADISGLSVNATTNQHTTRIIFGGEKKPQGQFVYTDLSEMFPGYKFDHGRSTYRGEETGEGGYVYSEPGIYENVALLDIASMHPTSIECLNLFGPYTQHFSDIKQARIYIKHKDFESAGKMFGGKLAKYLTSDEQAEALSYALKIAINSVYGLTSANFENPFKDPRNIDNIVAKRGALFMIDLKHAVQELGYTVAHIKTDSIKIPDATPEIIEFVMNFGKQYGYTFEHEATYEKMCLVNDAVYIAKYKGGKHDGEWTATGAQFQVPYVFKALFSHEPIEFADVCETKEVKTALYLDMNEKLPDVSAYEKELAKIENKDGVKFGAEERAAELHQLISKGHNYHFVGKVGSFCPVKAGCGGGLLMREKDGKYSAATGTKGYRWMESEMVKTLSLENQIDLRYYAALVDEAVASISEYGDFEAFAS